MTPPRSEGFVRMPDAEFEAILTRAAEEGAKRALADVGLDGDEAALDIRDLRWVVQSVNYFRRPREILHLHRLLCNKAAKET
ncbi:hypothetical protein KBY28_08245 [Ruegeria pomeroyi]|uniref:DUF6127 family protein n=1 Tax=Ruegeria pomeroyi TaxID=89184 RepID=UPI001F42BEFC|nr:DUF6127 family protein [Ruegeria pomeroyi]MCE8508434.1 hypothetical protein [Ruegeria pomeroyi]